jgi:hypothetical protein
LTLDEEIVASGSKFGQSESLVDVLADLRDHRRLLQQILSPIWDDNGAKIQSAERKLALRLLREMDTLLQQASKHCEKEFAQDNAAVSSFCCT